MAVHKEEKANTWRAVYRYTDWHGAHISTCPPWSIPYQEEKVSAMALYGLPESCR